MNTVTMSATMMVLALALMISSSSSQPAEQDQAITCKVPDVKKGDPSNVTCDFTVDVSTVTRPVSVYVELHRENADDLTALDCTLFEIPPNKCTVNKKFTFSDKEIGRQLVLNIPATTDEYAGQYVCKMMPQAEDVDPQPCTFNFIVSGSTSTPIASQTTRAPPDVTSTRKGDNVSSASTEMNTDATKAPAGKGETGSMSGGAIAGIIVAVVLLVLIAVGVALALRYRDRLQRMCCERNSTDAEDGEADTTISPLVKVNAGTGDPLADQVTAAPPGENQDEDRQENTSLSANPQGQETGSAEAAEDGGLQTGGDQEGTSGDDDQKKPLLEASPESATPQDQEERPDAASQDEGLEKEDDEATAAEDGDRKEEPPLEKPPDSAAAEEEEKK